MEFAARRGSRCALSTLIKSYQWSELAHAAKHPRDRPRPHGALLGAFGGTALPEPSRPLLPVEHPLGARGSHAGLSDGRPGRSRVYRASRPSNSSAPDGRNLVGIAHFDPLPVAARNAPSNRGGQEKALACALRRRAAHARRSACALDFLTSRCESLSRAGRSMVVLDPPLVRVVSVSRLHFARRSAPVAITCVSLSTYITPLCYTGLSDLK